MTPLSGIAAMLQANPGMDLDKIQTVPDYIAKP
jgi:hypothetical protein